MPPKAYLQVADDYAALAAAAVDSEIPGWVNFALADAAVSQAYSALAEAAFKIETQYQEDVNAGH